MLAICPPRRPLVLGVSGPDQRKFPILVHGLRVGEVGYYLDVGHYWVHYQVAGDQQRRGYATTGLGLLFDLMRQRGHHEAFALIRPWNLPSLACAAKVGLVEYRRNQANIYLHKELTA